MVSLIIDTSTERGLVALMKESTALYHCELPFGYQNAQHLFPAIEEGLRQAQLKISDLSFIAACIGPGSYTGIRVGAMVAKSLSFACQIPLVGINTLKGFLPASEGVFAVLIDAKIAGCYLLKGKHCAEGTHYSDEPMVCPLDKLQEQMGEIRTVVTPHGSRFRSMFPQLEWEEKAPCAKHLSSIASHKFHAGQVSHDSTLELCYLR